MRRLIPEDPLDRDPFVRARIDPYLKEAAQSVLKPLGVSLSELMRELLIRIVDSQNLPFSVRTRTGMVHPTNVPTLAERLIDEVLPELHQKRWSEIDARLRIELAEVKSRLPIDPITIEEVERRIAVHSTNRFKPESSRQALIDEANNKARVGKSRAT